MIKFLLALTLLFAAPILSFAKTPKCPKGDKACAKKAAKKDKKSDKKTAKKHDKKADKKATAKKSKKDDKKVAKHKSEKKKKKKTVAEEFPPVPDAPTADSNEPMGLPDSFSTPAASSPEPTASATSAPATQKNDLEDDIFPESTSGSGPTPASTPSSDGDFLDDELPAE